MAMMTSASLRCASKREEVMVLVLVVVVVMAKSCNADDDFGGHGGGHDGDGDGNGDSYPIIMFVVLMLVTLLFGIISLFRVRDLPLVPFSHPCVLCLEGDQHD